MILGDSDQSYQVKVISRAWQAMGIRPGAITDELMAEWLEHLAPLTVDQVDIGVKKCQQMNRTAPADEFVTLCQAPQPKARPSTTVAEREKERQRQILNGEK